MAVQRAHDLGGLPVIEANIAGCGLAPWLGRVRTSDVPVLDLERHPATATAAVQREAAAARREDAVDAIILGCAGMVHVTRALRQASSLHVVDPVEAATTCVGWLVART